MAKLVDYAGRPSSGTVPFAVVGIVTDLEDPDSLARIKVKFPTLQDEPESWWLRQVSPNAGKGRGFYALPEKDDEVLVLFMQGSQDVGVIIGQFWNGKDTPPEIEAGSQHDSNHGVSAPPGGGGGPPDNDRRFWKSRSGHMFIFDDCGGSETVEIWDQSGNMSLVFNCEEGNIQLSNADGSIEISASGDVSITAGGDFKYYADGDIIGESGGDMKLTAGGDFVEESTTATKLTGGTDVKIEASVGFEAKGTTAKVEGSGTADLKGAMTTVDGSGMCKISGGMVMIN